MAFICCQTDLQGLSKPAAPVQSGEIIWPGLHTFASPSECDSIRAGSVGPTSPPVISASSHGIRAASAADFSPLASTPPDPKVRLRSPVTTPTTCSALVVSHHLDGLLRERAVSLLRLTAGWRFAAFPVRSPTCTLPKQHSVERVRTVPRSACSHPSKDSPHLQPYRVATAVALLTLPPSYPSEEESEVRGLSLACASSSLSTRGRLASPTPRCQGAASACFPRTQLPSRPCSADESVLPPSRCQLDRQPILPWALFPSKVT